MCTHTYTYTRIWIRYRFFVPQGRCAILRTCFDTQLFFWKFLSIAYRPCEKRNDNVLRHGMEMYWNVVKYNIM